jgi:hypothetical protein
MGFSGFGRASREVFPCDVALIYEVLTDYDSYSEWMPFITTSKLLAKEGSLAIAQFDLVRPREDRLVIEWIHTTNKAVLGRIIGGKVPISEVEWTIEPAHPGHSAVTVAIKQKMIWHWLSPAYWTLMTPEKWLHALRSRISVFLPDLVLPGKDAETVLELWETDKGFVCWIRGKKYTLAPAPDSERI